MIYVFVTLVALSPVIILFLLSAFTPKPTNLGLVDGRLADCPNSPNCVMTQAADAEHQIAPIPFEGSPDEAMKQLKAVIATIPRMIIVSETQNYIRAEVTSLTFRFTDDVEFAIDAEAKVIDFRSASRVGRSDLGINRARMERIRNAFAR